MDHPSGTGGSGDGGKKLSIIGSSASDGLLRERSVTQLTDDENTEVDWVCTVV